LIPKKTDTTGAYCIPALPGKYIVSPDIKEMEAGLLTETSYEVIVESSPVLEINFEQARLTVSGRVRCIESPCDTSYPNRGYQFTPVSCYGFDSNSYMIPLNLILSNSKLKIIAFLELF